MRKFLLFLILLIIALPVYGEVITIYKKDGSWIDGDLLQTQTIFKREYYILYKEGKVYRIEKKDVFKVIQDESEDKEFRVQFHFDNGMANYQRGYLEEAMREFKKVLSIDPNNIPAKNNLAIIKAKLGDYYQKEEKKKETEKKEYTLDEVQAILKLREDQKAFLEMVAEAHNVDFKQLISLAIDNWIKDYKDYKIAPEEESKLLPPLRHPLLPTEQQ